MKRRESPIPRINPSGARVWVARYTGPDGKRRFAKPSWNRGKATFALKREAQEAIDEAYRLPGRADTLGAYAATWIDDHPRSVRTDASNRTRLRAVLDVEIEGRRLRDWPYPELRRKHMVALVDHMLRVEGRAVKGAVGIRNTLSAMTEDAITDEVAEVNFAKGFKIRANDPRVRKPPRKIRIWTFDQMREFASAGRADVRARSEKPEPDKKTGETLYYSAVNYEPMLATFGLANLRIGEVFALLRAEMDLEALLLRPSGNAFNGVITRGNTETKEHEGEVPIPPSLALLYRDLPPRIDTPLLFPTPKGTVFHDSSFRRDVWKPAQVISGLPIKPHECRHSYVTHLRAAGVDPADLAEVTRQDIDTATRHYTQPLGQSMELIREVIG